MRTGKWLIDEDIGYYCSECKYSPTDDYAIEAGDYKFCPYCGASMIVPVTVVEKLKLMEEEE